MPEIQVTVKERIAALQGVILRLQAQNSELMAMNVILSGRLAALEANPAELTQPTPTMHGANQSDVEAVKEG